MKVPGLIQRRGIFYLRRRVPAQLKLIVNEWIVSRSLKTKRFSQALPRFTKCDMALKHIFTLSLHMAELDPEFTKRYFHEMLRRWMGQSPDSFAPSLPTPISEIAQKMENQDGELYDIGLTIKWNEPSFNDALSSNDEQAIMSLGLLALRTAQEHYHQLEAQKNGQRSTTAFDPYFDGALNFHNSPTSHSGPPEAKNAASMPNHSAKRGNAAPGQGTSIQDVFDAFQAEEGNRWDVKRKGKFKEAHRLITELFGQNHPISAINEDDMRKVKATIIALPVNANKKAAYKGKSIVEQVRLADEVEDPNRIHPTTVNDRLKHIALWFEWAKSNRYITDNVFKGVNVKASKSRQDRRTAYTPDQLVRLFEAPVFRGMQNPSKWSKPGKLIERNMRYWVPIIAIHTGMRLEEICQLRIEHIEQVEGVWCVNLRDDLELKIKTEAGARLVPIHSNLWTNWGFGDWVKKRQTQETSSSLLFEDAEIQSDGRYSSSISKWFNRLLKAQDLKTNQLTFHSLRHTFVDLLREASVEDELIKTLIGHSSKDVTTGYGKGYSPRVLNEAVRKISFHFDGPHGD